MHREDALLGQYQVHDGENRFFDLACIPGSTNNDFLGCIIDDNKALRIESINLRVCFEVRGVQNGEFRFMLLQLLCIGSNEHVPGEGVVPGVVVHHSNGERFRKIGSAVEVLHEK